MNHGSGLLASVMSPFRLGSGCHKYMRGFELYGEATPTSNLKLYTPLNASRFPWQITLCRIYG